MNSKIAIFPSLISADLLHLADVITSLERYCDGFHLDIMDWHFVPNLTWGAAFINAIAQYTNKPLFIHLMIERSLAFIETFKTRPNDTIAFHIEEAINVKKMLQAIRTKQCRTSIAINPGTPLERIFEYLNDTDNVLLMSVEPGFSGQTFIESSFERLHTLNMHRQKNRQTFTITMDGGINKSNIQKLVQNNVDQVGVAAAIFKSTDPIAALQELYANAHT